MPALPTRETHPLKTLSAVSLRVASRPIAAALALSLLLAACNGPAVDAPGASDPASTTALPAAGTEPAGDAEQALDAAISDASVAAHQATVDAAQTAERATEAANREVDPETAAIADGATPETAANADSAAPVDDTH